MTAAASNVTSPARATPRHGLGTLLILLATLAVYWPALRGTWLWDDDYEVAANPILRDPAGLAKIWRGEGALDYFPLKATAQWLLWRVWGDAPLGWHLANVALHMLSAILLWRLLRRLAFGAAWVGALAFAVHPVAVESIGWIAEFKNALSLPLALLAALAYVEFDDTGRRGAWSRAILWFIAALLCKSTVVMLPCVLVLILWWRRGRLPGSADWRNLAPLFGVALILGLVTIAFQHGRAIGTAAVPVGGLAVRLVRASLALGFYGEKAVWPLHTMPVYPRWPLEPMTVWMLMSGVGLAALAGILGWSAYRGNWLSRGALAAGAAFAAMLLPILGLLGMAYMHVTWVADHFAYAALPVFAAFLAGAIDTVRDRLAGRWRLPAAVALTAVLGLWTIHARLYARHFASALDLWTYAVAENPTSPVAHTNLGNALHAAGRVGEAALHFAVAAQLDPKDPGVHLNLGNALGELGQKEGALREHERAVALAPLSALAYNCLAGSLLDVARLPEARAAVDRALQLQPSLAEAHNNLGLLLLRTDEPAAAAREFEAAVQLKPDLRAARENLARLRREQGGPKR